MTDPHPPSLSLSWIQQLGKIPIKQWNRLAHAVATPFLEWEWLHQLEISDCVGAETGWYPNHLTAWRGKRLVAAAPLYVKTHSDGEFVFDRVWAQVARKLEVAYFPKMVGMSPFSPVTGYRFLIAPEEDQDHVTHTMLAAIDAFCLQHHISGCHFMYVAPEWRHQVLPAGYIPWRHAMSFEWHNRGYPSFEAYLQTFNANQRRNIKRERRMLRQEKILLEMVAGEAIEPALLAQMYAYYASTNAKYGSWGCKYLTPSFFDGLHENYRHRLMVAAAFHEGDPDPPAALSLFLVKGERLYGRYWGSRVAVPGLHFNACYYAPMEWAIERGIRLFDPGLGSTHKLRRGFKVVPSYSLHRFQDARLQWVMQTHIDAINRAALEEIEFLNRQRPVKRG